MKNKKCYHFDGTMLVSVGEIKSSANPEMIIKNILCFEQTTIKREPDKKYPEVKINPDLFFIFYSEKSVDSMIHALNELKQNFKEV